MGDPAAVPLTLPAAAGSWTVDVLALIVIGAVGGGYYRRSRRSDVGPAWCFYTGLTMWALTVCSAIGVYAPVLFWVRALQVLLLLYVVPFFLAAGRPVATFGLGAVVTGRAARILLSPLTTSLAMLAAPWLLYLTPWYIASMGGVTGAATRLLLVVVGFGYFYARLQADPVPRRYSPLLSIGISIAEGLGDGILGIVLWLGPLIAQDYYTGLGRTWGPSLRTDQSVGAGILWILGDVLALPFLLVLFRSLRTHESARAEEVDAAMDARADAEPATTGLWWESDPELRERFRR